jgi:hypothetical protein
MNKFAVLIAMTCTLALAPAAEARKPIRVLGCSASDLNGFGASICVKKGEQDVLSGSSSVHVAVCSGGQVYCCISKDGATSGGRCTNVSSKTGGNHDDHNDSGGSMNDTSGSSSGGNGCSGDVC